MDTPETDAPDIKSRLPELRLRTLAALCLLLITLVSSWGMDVLGIAAAAEVADPYVFFNTVGLALAFLLALSAYLNSAHGWGRFAAGLELVGYVLLAGNVLMRLSYVLMAFSGAYGYWDDTLLQADRALGYDWKLYLQGIASIPNLPEIFAFAYYTWVLQMICILFYLIAIYEYEKLFGFIFVFLLSGAICCLISMFVPAQALPYYQACLADPALVAADGRFLRVLNALRDGVYAAFSKRDAFGIITFPSFHAAVAVALLWVCASRPVLKWVFLLPGVLMIVSALHIGGHYLVDLLAGALVAFWCIAVARWVAHARSRPLSWIDRFFLAAHRSRERAKRTHPAGISVPDEKNS